MSSLTPLLVDDAEGEQWDDVADVVVVAGPGQELRFEWAGRVRHVSLNLIGGFQADNALLAAGLCIGTGSDPDEVFDSLHALTTVRGRMQFVAPCSYSTANSATWKPIERLVSWKSGGYRYRPSSGA